MSTGSARSIDASGGVTEDPKELGGVSVALTSNPARLTSSPSAQCPSESGGSCEAQECGTPFQTGAANNDFNASVSGSTASARGLHGVVGACVSHSAPAFLPRDATSSLEESPGEKIGLAPRIAMSSEKDPTIVTSLSTVHFNSEATAETPEEPPTPVVWSTAGVSAVKASLTGDTVAIQQGVENAQRSGGIGASNTNTNASDSGGMYAALYACALRPCNLRADGNQRDMGKEEEDTFFACFNGDIHLDELPLFMNATHTSLERIWYGMYHAEKLGSRIYIQLPVGSVLPATGATRTLWINLREGAKERLKEGEKMTAKAAAREQQRLTKLNEFFQSITDTVCLPNANMVIVRFTKPQDRDKWKNQTLGYGRKGKVQLVATDVLTSANPEIGYDAASLQILYHVMILDDTRRLTLQQVCAIGEAASKMKVVHVVGVKSASEDGFAPFMWKITFGQLDCPPLLKDIRRVRINNAAGACTVTMHHPRSAYRYPCAKCLGTRHATKDCKTTNPELAAARHHLDIDAPPLVPLPPMVAMKSKKAFLERDAKIRAIYEPALHAKLAMEKDVAKRKMLQQAEATLKQQTDEKTRVKEAQKLRRHQAEERRRMVKDYSKQLQEWRREKSASLAKKSALVSNARPRSPKRKAEHQLQPTLESVPSSSTAESNKVQSMDPESAEPTLSQTPRADVRGLTTTSGAHLESTQTSLPELGSTKVQREQAAHPLHANGIGPLSIDPNAPLRPKPVNPSSSSFRAATPRGLKATTPRPSNRPGSRGASRSRRGSRKSTPATTPKAKAPGAGADEGLTVSSSGYVEAGGYPAHSGAAVQEVTVGAQAPDRHVQELAISAAEKPCADGELGKRERRDPNNAALDEDGDATMRTNEMAKGPAAKKERRDETDEEMKTADVAETTAGSGSLAPQAGSSGCDSKVALIQQSMTGFLSVSGVPTNREPVNSSDTSPQILEEGVSAVRLDTMTGWLTDISGHVVSNLENGWCLQQSVDAAMRPFLSEPHVGDSELDIKEANWYKDYGATYLLAYLPQMIDDKTITLSRQHGRYYGLPFGSERKATEDFLQVEVVNFIYDTMDLDCRDAVTSERWGGAEEILALVWLLRRPIFVFTRQGDSVVEIQIYVIEKAPVGSQYDEQVKIRRHSREHTHAIIKRMLKNHVIPILLTHEGDPEKGHFEAIRFPSHFYEEWHDEDREAEPMQRRMEIVLEELGMYAARPRLRLDLAVRPEVGSTADAHESKGSAGDQVSPPLSTPQLLELHRSLNSYGKLRGERKKLWQTADAANISVLHSTLDDDGSVDDLHPQPHAITAAFSRRKSNPMGAVRLLRRLPFPFVAIAALPKSMVIRLGKEIVLAGRERVFAAWIQQLCADEASELRRLTYIPTDNNTDERWIIAQNSTTWDEMGKLLDRDVTSHRLLSKGKDDDGLRLVVALVASLPLDLPVGDVCYIVHEWIAANATEAQGLMKDMRANDWTTTAAASRSIVNTMTIEPPAASAAVNER